MKKKTVVGRVEFIDFPKLKLTEVEAKVDTGAYSTSIHCEDIEEKEDEKGKKLCFTIVHPVKKTKKRRVCVRTYSTVYVKSSNGQREKRYAIESSVRMANKVHITKLTLSNRDNMKYPVLLGRKLLRGNYIVDVDLKHNHT